jgi:hypothetical protein
MGRYVQIAVDCHHPDALAAFWADVLGYELRDPPAGYDSWAMIVDSDRR